MKKIYVLLIALATGGIGIGVGLLVGGGFGGIFGLATGSIYSVCLLTETAKESGLLNQAQTDELFTQFKEKVSSDFQLKGGALQEL